MKKKHMIKWQTGNRFIIENYKFTDEENMLNKTSNRGKNLPQRKENLEGRR